MADSVGWFHYHTGKSGYSSETFLVCRGCGTMLSVQHAARGCLPALVSRRRARPNLLKTRPGPTSAEHSGDYEIGGFAGWEILGSTNRADLRNRPCQHCGTVGQFASNWPSSGAPCPRCGVMVKERKSFLGDAMHVLTGLPDTRMMLANAGGSIGLCASRTRNKRND
jgi:hypothetical protein